MEGKAWWATSMTRVLKF